MPMHPVRRQLLVIALNHTRVSECNVYAVYSAQLLYTFLHHHRRHRRHRHHHAVFSSHVHHVISLCILSVAWPTHHVNVHEQRSLETEKQFLVMC